MVWSVSDKFRLNAYHQFVQFGQVSVRPAIVRRVIYNECWTTTYPLQDRGHTGYEWSAA